MLARKRSVSLFASNASTTWPDIEVYVFHLLAPGAFSRFYPLVCKKVKIWSQLSLDLKGVVIPFNQINAFSKNCRGGNGCPSLRRYHDNWALLRWETGQVISDLLTDQQAGSWKQVSDQVWTALSELVTFRGSNCQTCFFRLYELHRSIITKATKALPRSI